MGQPAAKKGDQIVATDTHEQLDWGAHARRELRIHLGCDQRVEQLAVLRVRIAVEHQRDERAARAHERARELDHVGFHRVDVAPLGDLEDVLEVEDGDMAVVGADDALSMDQRLKGGLDVGHPGLEHLGEEHRHTWCFGHDVSVAQPRRPRDRAGATPVPPARQ